ncbi:unnamed protein product [Dovyalis caffra]|uniref:PIN-like protein n=1 Tax=Dovyalis caffra TaxID=77055 RepID=A0AAV1STB2_9ROSI|nr:unnamed protein product [Dovyalis caffra]
MNLRTLHCCRFSPKGGDSGDSLRGELVWTITLFSLCTLPNTLVMGVPLLKSMYGEFTSPLMVQIVFLQSAIWYTLMLFMFEYRGAKRLIAEKFPETAASISSFKVDSDVVSQWFYSGASPNKELHMFVWSPSVSSNPSDRYLRPDEINGKVPTNSDSLVIDSSNPAQLCSVTISLLHASTGIPWVIFGMVVALPVTIIYYVLLEL